MGSTAWMVVVMALGQAQPLPDQTEQATDKPTAGEAAIVEQLKAMQQDQAQSADDLANLRSQAEQSRQELQQLRFAQEQERVHRARQLANAADAVASLEDANSALALGDFDADDELAQTLETLGNVPGPRADTARWLVAQSRLELSNRNFQAAQVDAATAVELLRRVGQSNE